MAERLVEVDYSAGEGLTLRFKPRSLGLIPEPTRGHIRAANRELLLALRSFVDQVIEGMEPEENTPPRRRRRVRVKDSTEGTPEE